MTSQILHPWLLFKRPWTIGVFMMLAVVCAALADPKLFEILTPVVQKVPTAVSVTAVIVFEGLLLAIIWLTLESRYAVTLQAHVAAVLFLMIVTAASVLGFWIRMALAADSTGGTRLFGPGGYTFSEGIAALLALTGTGSIFITAQNLIFLRKADYTVFLSARAQLVEDVRAMKDRFDAKQPLSDSDAATLLKRCSDARVALNAPWGTEVGAYRRFVEEQFIVPLDTLCALASSADVQGAAEMFLRACGLVTPSDPYTARDVTTMAAAFRKVEEPSR